MKGEAMFGAGCFWGVQQRFDKLGGVKTEVGYSGGKEEKGEYSYEEVCSGKTGHAEVVKIDFDLKKTKYEDLLEVFWKIHDPTQLDRQGPDRGSQYRSAIFYFDKEQKKIAEESLKTREKEISGKIVTKIEKAGKFYKAEEYHQKYLSKGRGRVC